MHASPYLCNLVLDAVLDEGVYASLHDGEPGDHGESELSGGSYERAQLRYDSAADGRKELSEDLVFKNLPKRTGIGWVGIWDAKKGGHFLWGLPIVEPQDTNAGSTVIIPAGHLNHTAY